MMETRPPALVLQVPSAIGLSVGESVVFRYRREAYDEQGFLLRIKDGFVAFANSCPHWNVDLDLGDERFYDDEIDRIYCKNHGATFLPSDGTCDAGPCFGRRLTQFNVVVLADSVSVEIPDAEPP